MKSTNTNYSFRFFSFIAVYSLIKKAAHEPP
jgi:hypothetical protein